jgi:hypothetical protein
VTRIFIASDGTAQGDIETSRRKGLICETEHFPALMRQFGLSFHRFAKVASPIIQRPDGSHVILPDFWLIKQANLLVELKHKYATCDKQFGLEEYRAKSLCDLQELVGDTQTVLYVIHDHARWWDVATQAGKPITVEQFIAADVRMLAQADRRCWGPSWVSGVKKKVPICYWKESRFLALARWLA